jgi:hypothetical protein
MQQHHELEPRCCGTAAVLRLHAEHAATPYSIAVWCLPIFSPNPCFSTGWVQSLCCNPTGRCEGLAMAPALDWQVPFAFRLRFMLPASGSYCNSCCGFNVSGFTGKRRGQVLVLARGVCCALEAHHRLPEGFLAVCGAVCCSVVCGALSQCLYSCHCC